MKDVGQKIAIVGVSASGKSTFARKLRSKLQVPLIHMDTIMWKPGWNYIGEEETAKKLKEEAGKPAWIIEGYIVKEARMFVFEQADTIIYLDYHPLVASLRYIQRWWKHRKNPRIELNGSPDKFSFKFLKLVWTKGEVISLGKYLKGFEQKTIVLKSPKEASKFLSKL